MILILFSFCSYVFRPSDVIGLDLVRQMVEPDPKKRISARNALRHRYFRSSTGTARYVHPTLLNVIKGTASSKAPSAAAATTASKTASQPRIPLASIAPPTASELNRAANGPTKVAQKIPSGSTFPLRHKYFTERTW
jgi:hypothetical protein